MTDPGDSQTPQAFASYSWDSEQHQNWVLRLATRLRSDGIDVVLDRWDATLGSDLTLFMEQAGNTRYRVLAIVTERYVEKADAAEGGVGYERRMITPTLMKDLHGDRVIPLLRDNPEAKLPRFLGAARYVDFRDDGEFEDRYHELLQELHGMPETPKPPLGRNPFETLPTNEVQVALRHDPARYVMPALESEASFDHTSNNGQFVIGAGERSFTLQFSEGGHGSAHIYSDPADIVSIALAPGVRFADDIGDASSYDGSSRARMVRVGDAAIVRNRFNYWAAVFVDEVLTRDSSPTGEPVIRFRYLIPAVPSSLFEAEPG